LGVERRRELHNRFLERIARGRKETIDTSAAHLDLVADLEPTKSPCSQNGRVVLESTG
jgi:Na+/phosphate symporter